MRDEPKGRGGRTLTDDEAATLRAHIAVELVAPSLAELRARARRSAD